MSSNALRARAAGAAALLVAAVTTATHAQEGDARAPLDTAWASIARTYYDTVLVNGRWKSTFDSLRHSLGATPSREAVRGAIRTLIAVPGQSHFALIPSEAFPSSNAGGSGSGTPGTAGLDVRMLADTLAVWRVAPAGAAAEAGIRPGDVVTMLGPDTIATVAARLTAAFPNDPRHARMLVNSFAMGRLRQSVGDTIRITVRNAAGEMLVRSLVHRPVDGQITRYGNLPPLVMRVVTDTVTVGRGRRAVRVPVLHFSAFFPVVMQEVDRFLFGARQAPAVIIDLRGNPGGVIGMIGGIAGHFTDTITSLGTMYGRGSTMYLRTNPRLADASGTRQPVISAPVAILVDGMSASSSEFFAAGLQGIGRARVFGDQTSGQALPAAMVRLPGGDVLMHPIADHKDANGRQVEGVGVTPDTPAPLTLAALRAGRDPALDAAREWLARTLAR